MWDGTVIAELVAQSRSGHDPAGQVCRRRWPVRTSVAWPRGSGLPPRGLAPISSGGRRGPVAAGCPRPVEKHAHDGTHNCGPHRDQGDLPARHSARETVVGVVHGLESRQRASRR
jgi:hypothetical protein